LPTWGTDSERDALVGLTFDLHGDKQLVNCHVAMIDMSFQLPSWTSTCGSDSQCVPVGPQLVHAHLLLAEASVQHHITA